jgi:alkylhydroperoxidase/carboxymuconolactone decarboxylase family protein YurZ
LASEQTDTPVLDVLAAMTAASIDATSLGAEEVILVRIAALVAADAPPISYALNLGVAGEAGIDPEKIRGVFAAIAPIVGTARVATAMGNVARALAFSELAEYDLEDESA